jgi:uncharacterized membrane protein
VRILIIGIALFFVAHLMPLAPGLRGRLTERLGRNAYLAASSLVSAVGLVLMIWGYSIARAAPSAATMVYQPPDWARPATIVLVFLAFISFGIYLHKTRLRNLLRSPMSIAIALWATGHLLSNGSLPSLVLFGSFLLYALVDIAVNAIRGTVPAIIPKPRHDIAAVLAGMLLFALFFFVFHPYVLNRPLV